jgi:hypothetical protein
MRGSDRKAARLENRKQSDEQPLTVRRSVVPGINPNTEMHATSYAKGIIRLSEFFGLGNAPTLPSSRPPSEATFGLHYQCMSELQVDHGMATISEVLVDADLWILDRAQRETMLSEIEANVPPAVWPMVLERLQPPVEGDEDLHDPLIVALWGEIFVEPLSDTWLAAMARHAYHVERDEFAFGYLTAQLDHRRQTERDFLRGRKSVESGKVGAEISAKRHSATTARVLDEMKRIQGSGHTISRAADIAADRGIGTSAAANRKLWNRHLKK